MTAQQKKQIHLRLQETLEGYSRTATVLPKKDGERSGKGFSNALSTVGMVGALTATPFLADPVEAAIVDIPGTAVISGLNATHQVTGLFGTIAIGFYLNYNTLNKYSAYVYYNNGAYPIGQSSKSWPIGDGNYLAGRFSFSSNLTGPSHYYVYFSHDGNVYNNWDDPGAYYVT